MGARTRPTINSDMGESYGNFSFGNDEPLLELVNVVNVACGMHAGDPSGMHETVRAALEVGVAVGAHPGLPDVIGFGRRQMALEADEVRDLVLYQVGALTGFLRAEGGALAHIKPHGALYGMLAQSEDLTAAVCDVCDIYGVGLYGMAGTAHETVARRRGIPFVSELYVDVAYNDAGGLVGIRRPHRTPLDRAKQIVHAAMTEGRVPTISGGSVPVSFESVCVHSDTPNAVEVAATVRDMLDELTG